MMKPLSVWIIKFIAEVLATISSKERFKRVIAEPLYRNAFYLILNNALVSISGLVFWIVVARFYSETEVGYGSAIISAINLLALLTPIGLNFSIIRFLSHVERPSEFINSNLTLNGIIGTVIAVIFTAGLDLWSPALAFIKQNAIFHATFLILAVLSSLSNLIESVFVARRRAGFVLYKNALFVLLRIPFVIILAGFFQTFGVIASWSAGIGIAFTISLFLFLPRVEDGYKAKPSLRLGYLRSIGQYSGGSYLASLLARAPMMILPLMVVNILGTASNAYFYIAWMIASTLFTIPGSVSRSLFAEGSHSMKNIQENVIRSIKVSLLLLVPVMIILIAIGKWLLLLFGPGYSTNALILLWLLLLAVLPRGIINIYIGLLRVQDKLKELILIRGFIAVTVVILCLFVIPAYDIIGVGYVWLGVHFIVSIVLLPRLIAQTRRVGRTEGTDWEDGDSY